MNLWEDWICVAKSKENTNRKIRRLKTARIAVWSLISVAFIICVALSVNECKTAFDSGSIARAIGGFIREVKTEINKETK